MRIRADSHPVLTPAALGLCFALLALLCGGNSRVLGNEANQPEGDADRFGSVEGVVRFRGEVPKSPTPDDSGTNRDLLEVDRRTQGLRFAVVYLMPDNSSAAQQTARPPEVTALEKTVMVDQRHYVFTPHVVAVRAGQPVNFTSSDTANHNVHASSSNPTNEFNVFTGLGGKYERRFVGDTLPVRLSCDIHPWMRGWIYVFDSPMFAVTDAQGRFRIGSIPPGEYILAVKQPDVRYAHERTIAITNRQTTKVEIEIRAEDFPQPKE